MNLTILIGRLTAKPTLSDKGVCKATLAVRRDAETTDFIGITLFGKTAENFTKYMDKGREVAITGSIHTGSYEKEGKKIYTQDVIVRSFDFIGSKNDTNAKEMRV